VLHGVLELRQQTRNVFDAPSTIIWVEVLALDSAPSVPADVVEP
jgi:hypothetical protein